MYKKYAGDYFYTFLGYFYGGGCPRWHPLPLKECFYLNRGASFLNSSVPALSRSMNDIVSVG